MSSHVPDPAPYRPAAVVDGWTVHGRADRVWLHRAWPNADGDLTPDAAETLAAALSRAAADARHPAGGSWTRHPQGGCHDHPA